MGHKTVKSRLAFVLFGVYCMLDILIRVRLSNAWRYRLWPG